MNNVDRAKQFMAFDALKGLREELAKRERKKLMVDKKEISEEQKEQISYTLLKLEVGSKVKVIFYKNGFYFTLIDCVSKINTTSNYLLFGEQKIFFDDIYSLDIQNDSF